MVCFLSPREGIRFFSAVIVPVLEIIDYLTEEGYSRPDINST